MFSLLIAPILLSQQPTFENVAWRGTKGWNIGAESMSNAGPSPEHLFSTGEYGDAHVHVEFRIPKGSNSGVYVHGRYEIQILDSSGKKAEDLTFADCGGVYQRWKDEKGYEGKAPLVNAFKGAGEWNVYDIYFRAPRFDGKKVENARFLEVRLNGVMIQRDVEVTGPTRAAYFQDEKPTGPIVLQADHGPVEFRNVWVRRL